MRHGFQVRKRHEAQERRLAREKEAEQRRKEAEAEARAREVAEEKEREKQREVRRFEREKERKVKQAEEEKRKESEFRAATLEKRSRLFEKLRKEEDARRSAAPLIPFPNDPALMISLLQWHGRSCRIVGIK